MEYMGGRDLNQHLAEWGRLEEPEARHLFQEIVKGVIAWHRKNVLHRDLKLENILLDASKTRPKICDFGASKIIKRTAVNFGRYGTPVYIAPEVVNDRGYVGFSSDVWSLGVMLFAMVAGTVPFMADTFQKLSK